MKSDIELFKEYDRELAGSYNKSYYLLDLLRNAVSAEVVEMLDLTACETLAHEVLRYLFLKKRYVLMKQEAGSNLSLTKDGFKIYESTFSTLDEVERALKQKAFL